MKEKFSPLGLSFFLHGLVLASYFLLKLNLDSFAPLKKIPIEVLQYPQVASAQLKLQPIQPQDKSQEPKPPPQAAPKKVFGVNRKAMKALPSDATENTVEVKAGNTAAKENDQLQLEKEDPDSIPIPAAEGLITSQVDLVKEVRIPYPPEAKKANLEGPVVMDLIIDDKGKVRSVVLIRGPGESLSEAAVEAAKSFEFRPAQIGNQPVAVKIRYTYRFVLENR